MRQQALIEAATGIAVEVGNTMLNRLVLADALHYALHDDHPEPDFVVILHLNRCGTGLEMRRYFAIIPRQQLTTWQI